MMQLCELPPAQLPQQQAALAAGAGLFQLPAPQMSAGCRQEPRAAAAPPAAPPVSPSCQQPTTPAPAPRQPTHSCPSPSSGPSAAAAAAAVASAQGGTCAAHSARGASTQRALRAAQWRSLHSFINCICRSPLLKSALLSVELGGRHPGADCAAAAARGGALGWTLAQLLALHVRARLTNGEQGSVRRWWFGPGSGGC